MTRLNMPAMAAVASFGTIAIIWAVTSSVFHVPNYILPSPVAMAHAFVAGLVEGTLYPHILSTLHATAVGLALGCLAGVAVGGLLGEFESLHLSCFPILVGLQSIPLVALAPLIVAVFGYGVASKIFLVALICFFPVFVNTAIGTRSADRNMLNLYKVLGITRWRTFVEVKLPSAANYIFAGLEIAAVLSFIGCVVGEFVASQAGLGYLIKAKAGDLDVAMMFASIIVLAAFGAIAAALIRMVHRKLVFWT